MARPRVRSECASVPRPCPFASCRWNLLVDIDAAGGVHERQQPAWSTACALDEAEAGPRTLDEVGKLLGGLAREAARKAESKALAVFVRRAQVAGIIDPPPGMWWWTRARREVADRVPAGVGVAGEIEVDEERESDRDRMFVSFFGAAPDERVCRSIAGMVDKRRNGDGSGR